jgi:hypothetical protein
LAHLVLIGLLEVLTLLNLNLQNNSQPSSAELKYIVPKNTVNVFHEIITMLSTYHDMQTSKYPEENQERQSKYFPTAAKDI